MPDIFTPVVLGLHLATAHFGAPPNLELQSITPGVYLRSAAGLTIGAYSNSEGRRSAYAAWTFSTSDEVWSITTGAVTGYERAKLLPLVVPSFKTAVPTIPNWAMRIAYLPKGRKDSAQGIHFGLERRL